MSHKLYSTALGRIVDAGGKGDYTTISAALTAASSGETIFIRPGTYTENPTLKAGVNLVAYDGSHLTPTVTIAGTCTFTGAGTVTIAGIRLQTNSAAAIAVTGSAASVLFIENCYLNFTNNDGITFSSSSSSASITCRMCRGDLGTTGIKIFAHTSAGTLSFTRCQFTNTGASTTASTASSGSLQFSYTLFSSPITTSSTNAVVGIFSSLNTSTNNVTALTHGGASSTIANCSFASGTASAISIGGTLALDQCAVSCTNTNAITGAGTINYSNLSFVNTSQTINTTTQTVAGTIKGSTTTAPTAGFLGEEKTSSVTAVATTSTTTKSITSIDLTAGVWDVSCAAQAIATGGTVAMQAFIVGISTTNNAFTGTGGQDQVNMTGTANFSVMSLTVPRVRVTLTATTTYYLSVQTVYTSTTCPVAGRISATRVG